MAKLIEDSKLLKHSFDIYKCPSPCDECTGFYSGLGLRFRCLCDCHNNQFPTRRDVGITDKTVLTDIKVGELYTGLSKYSAHINRRYLNDGTIGKQQR